MCHADLDVIPYRWVRRNESLVVPDPDFSVTKQCRNFDALTHWAENNVVPNGQAKRKDLIAPQDAKVFEWPYR